MVAITKRLVKNQPLTYAEVDGNFQALSDAIDALSDAIDALGGVDDFLDLTDTPSTYSGQGTKTLAVKAAEDGIEFITPATGVTDHGVLTGLADDDHSQYHNDTRGDARYVKKSWTDASGATNAVAFTNYRCDTSGGGFTLTLPASPSDGDIIRIADASGDFATNNLTVARNGNNLIGLAEDMTVDLDHASFGLYWDNSKSSWYFI